jgi:hypothetical protein
MLRGLSALVLLLGVVFVASLMIVAKSLETGLDYLDEASFRVLVAFELLLNFGPKVVSDKRYGRALMAIFHQETDPRKPLTEQIGDVGLAGGPSIGPGQVYYKSAVDYGFFDGTSEEYETLASNLSVCVSMAVRVFKNKLADARGDFDEAIRRYNGSGTRAQKYAADALGFANSTWGGLS